MHDIAQSDESPAPLTTEVPGAGKGGVSPGTKLYPVSLRGLVVSLAIFILALYLVYGFYLEPPRWDKNFGVADNRHFFGPNTFFLDSCLKHGEYPLWNPLSYCGLPFAADGQASACYPFHLLRSVLTPAYDPYASAAGMQIMMVLHILWAGLGVFCLAQSYGLGLLASTVCGLIFMFSPYGIIYFSDYYVYSLTTAWAGWILWAVRRTLHARGVSQRLRHGAWAVVFFSMSALGGFPQLCLYIGIMVSLYILLDAVFNFSWKCSFKALRNIFCVLFSRAAFLIALAAGTALAAAVLLLPEMEMGLWGARTVVGGLKMPVWPQDLSPFHLLKCLVVYQGNTWGPEGCRAAGIGSLLVLIAALNHRRLRDVLVFLCLYLMMTDCTLGPPFPLGWLLRRFDVMNITVSPWRAGDFSILALGMVVGFGIDAAGRMPRRLRGRILRTAVLVGMGGGIAFVASHWASHVPRLLFQPTVWVWVLPSITFVFLGVFTWWNAPRLGRVVVALLIGGEVVLWSAQMLPNTVNRHGFANNPDTKRFGEAEGITLANRRRAHPRPNRQMWFLDHALNGYNPLFLGATSQVLCSPADDKDYFHRVHLRYKAVTQENPRGYLLVKRCFWLTRQWVAGALPDKKEHFPPTTTVFLPEVASGASLPVPEIPRDQLPGTPVSAKTVEEDFGKADALAKRIQRTGNILKIQFPTFKQDFVHAALRVDYRALAPVSVATACIDETGAYFTLNNTLLKKTGTEEGVFYVPLPDCETSTITISWPVKHEKEFQLLEACVLKDSADEDSHIVIEDRTANTVRVTLNDLPGARLLTFLDSYYPGWHARLDGREVEILKADDAFKSIVVPAGTHQVAFVYESMTTRIGLAFTLGTYAVLAGILLATRPRNRCRQAP